MWTYEQASGVLRKDGIRCVGYSGCGDGKNNPALQHVKSVGPIPVGLYTMGSPYNSELRGPLCIPLAPDESNVMFGRSAFLIHGDSIAHPGTASEGCIIMPRWMREVLSRSEDRRLMVVEGRMTGEVKKS